jgi:acetylornithine deacetylase/succinyl-diaminopimelate desuccinylase-like protein
MTSAGAMDGVDAVFGFHNMPFLPLGTVGSNPNTIMAGSASFDVNFTGRGGHAAIPHGNIDPVMPAAQFISSVQVRSAAERFSAPCSCLGLLRELESIKSLQKSGSYTLHDMYWCVPPASVHPCFCFKPPWPDL